MLFISTICPYSNYYNDLIRDMAAEFEKKGVLFLGVNSGRIETAEEARTHAREHGTPSRSPRTRRPAWRAARRPPHAGGLRPRSGREAPLPRPRRVEDLFARPEERPRRAARRAPVKPAETKAFGCAIPRD